jgi:nucleoside-diphosphate-sugar epimerase
MPNSTKIISLEKLEELISKPGTETIELLSKIDGDILFLGIGGKIGPSLAYMAKCACYLAGIKKKVIGVSQFKNERLQKTLANTGIETIKGDLLDTKFLKSLPAVKNIFFLAGMKFGAMDNLSQTWAINTYLPGLIAEHFKHSRIVAFSTGCVYPLVQKDSGGSKETDTPEAMGEYAQSCLGRERMFEYGSMKYGTPVTLIRLNYAVELRYGVLVDIALKVKNKQAVDLTMGYFNAIWQGDVNDYVLRSLSIVSSPAKILNITGPDILSVREVALEFGSLFNVEVSFTGKEADTALLSNSSHAFNLFGKPKTPISKIIKWIAHWLNADGVLLGKPTHFEVRDGKY